MKSNESRSVNRPEVATTLGPVRGLTQPDSGVVAFLGIPYAAPPLSERRFRPPAPPDPWSRPRDAGRFGPAAAQPFDPHEAPLGDYFDGDPPDATPSWVGSEDCLTVNVWSRLDRGGRRPVVIWIHGGANWLEGSRLSVYDGGALAARGDLVVASLNYRLGLFGFLDVSVLGGQEYAGTHSLGLRDQLAAIEWICANAAAFGGDPGNVTLIGESAGSMDISWLLTTGLLPRGVRRAILMSGVAGVPGVATCDDYSYYDEAEGRRQAREFLALLGVDSMATLLGASTGELLERMARALPTRDMLFYWDSLFYPRIDGSLLTTTPFDYVAQGKAKDRELIVGSTAFEMGLWLLWDPGLDRRNPLELVERIPGLPRSEAVALAEAYASSPAAAPGMQLLGDAIFLMPALEIAEAQARAGGRAWVYEFAWEVRDPRLRATHAADVGFFLGTWQTRGAEALIGVPAGPEDGALRARLGATLQDVVIKFASSGDPGYIATGGRPISWPAYETRTRPVMRFDASPTVLYDPYASRRERWVSGIYRRRPMAAAAP